MLSFICLSVSQRVICSSLDESPNKRPFSHFSFQVDQDQAKWVKIVPFPCSCLQTEIVPCSSPLQQFGHAVIKKKENPINQKTPKGTRNHHHHILPSILWPGIEIADHQKIKPESAASQFLYFLLLLPFAIADSSSQVCLSPPSKERRKTCKTRGRKSCPKEKKKKKQKQGRGKTWLEFLSWKARQASHSEKEWVS